MRANKEKLTSIYTRNCSSDSERSSWMEAVTPTQTSANPEEKIYEDWDCPRVESVEDYEAQDSDEIVIRKGDTANVLRKMSDSGETCFCPRVACSVNHI